MAVRKRPKKRAKPSAEARIAEYVDSPAMTHRLRQGKLVSARIAGNYGSYRTQAELGKKVTGACSCPSEYWPCKHVHALRKTWDVNPESFLDLKWFLKELGSQSKDDLVKAIETMVEQRPENLSLFGVPGFEIDDDDEKEDEDYDSEW
jgi:hypothetical protein